VILPKKCVNRKYVSFLPDGFSTHEWRQSTWQRGNAYNTGRRVTKIKCRKAITLLNLNLVKATLLKQLISLRRIKNKIFKHIRIWLLLSGSGTRRPHLFYILRFWSLTSRSLTSRSGPWHLDSILTSGFGPQHPDLALDVGVAVPSGSGQLSGSGPWLLYPVPGVRS
jgi:hypothetical protein